MSGPPTGTTTLTVADIMTLDPVVVRSDAPLEEAERLMRDRHISGLPVVDGFERLVGVISRTDILDDGSASLAFLLRRRPTGLRVGELMTSPAVTTSLGSSLVEAARLARQPHPPRGGDRRRGAAGGRACERLRRALRERPIPVTPSRAQFGGAIDRDARAVLRGVLECMGHLPNERAQGR